ncbi:MAG: Ig domain-containing protein [Clostridia bacterium]|nr:Ig domain-containing protein [Clostridia bacterium]
MKKFKKFLSVMICLIMAFQLTLLAVHAEEGAFVPVSGIILDKTELSMVYGGTAKLTASVVPAYASEAGIVWKSSNPNLVAVDANGNLTASPDNAESPSGAQKVTITVYSTFDNNISASCVVTVDNEPVNKIMATIKDIFNLLTAALPTIIEYGSTSIKPLWDMLVNFVKELLGGISLG